MRDRLLAFVADNHLVAEGERVLVGFSGGADSTCLLHLLHDAGFDLVAAHLNHGQRPEAPADDRHCSDFAASLGIPYIAGEADVPGLARDHRIGIEEAGRKARYAFFDQAAEQTGCGKIATAHTQSDLAETVLLNLVRGSGLAGLAGIPVARGSIIRPLLWAGREETAAYCLENNLSVLNDPGNEDIRFRRVQVRKNVLPELRKINSNVEDSLCKLAQIAGEEDRFLDSAAAAALEQAEIPLNGPLRFLTIDQEVALRRISLLHLPEVLLRRAVRLVASALGGELDFAQTQLVCRGLAAGDKGAVTAEGGSVVLEWDSERLSVYRNDVPEAISQPVLVPGITVEPGDGWQYRIVLEDAEPETPGREAMRVPIDIDAFRGPLHCRPAKPGETMRPLGGVGSRKLSDLLAEGGLTLMARRRLPILCDIIGPLWAPGVTLDERARPAAGGGRYLRVEFGPISGGMRTAETERVPQTYANS